MMVKKKQQKKNKFKSLRVIIPTIIVISISGLLATFFVSNAISVHNDEQKFLTLDREMYPVYERIKAVDRSMPWKYDKGCTPKTVFPGGAENCFVRIAVAQDVSDMKVYIDVYKKYEKILDDESVLVKTESSDWSIKRYDQSRLQVGYFIGTYKQKAGDVRCDYSSSLFSKDRRYENEDDYIDATPAQGHLEINCSAPAADFWFPESSKTYSSFDYQGNY